MTDRKTYTYAVVSCNGAGVHSSGHRTMKTARTAAERVSREYDWGHVEIERIEHVNGVPGDWPRRYWMRQRSRWVMWDPRRDASARKPDPLWGEARDD